MQVPNEIVRNEWFKLDAYAFAVYTRLKFMLFRNYGNNEIEFDHRKLMHKLHISDTRTLKKSFKQLHKEQIILEYIDKLPTKGALKVTFNPKVEESKGFTQFYTDIYNYIEDIGVIGLRLLFYYESRISRSGSEISPYCFAELRTIARELGIDKDTVKRYNDILKSKKLIKIDKHKLECTYDYDENDEIVFQKYNNHYYINENLVP